jgi:hypothetical protein
MTAKGNYALRLLASLKAEAEKIAKEEGTTLNQFINVAVAEKLSAMRTERYFKERAARGGIGDFWEFLDGPPGGGEPPRDSDRLSTPSRSTGKRRPK